MSEEQLFILFPCRSIFLLPLYINEVESYSFRISLNFVTWAETFQLKWICLRPGLSHVDPHLFVSVHVSPTI